MRLGNIRAWVGACVLALLVTAGAWTWLYLFDDGGVPGPKPPEHYTAWLEERWQAEGRNPESWARLELAIEKWRDVEETWFFADEPANEEFLTPRELIALGDIPKDGDLYAAAVRHIEGLREAGVFAAIRDHRLQGAGLPPWEGDLYDGLSDRPTFSASMQGLYLCQAAARLAMADGDEEEVLELIRDMWSFAALAGADRLMVGQLTSSAWAAETLREASALMMEVGWKDSALRALLLLFTDDPRPQWEEIREGERRWGACTDRRALIEAGLTKALARRSFARMYERFDATVEGRSVVELWKDPPGSVDLDSYLDRAVSGINTPSELISQVATSINMVASGWVSSEVQRRGTICLLAIELYRAEHNGALPDSLETALHNAGLDEFFAIDPVWDTPFIYTRDANDPAQYTLYAIGDGIDDGGVFPTDGSHLQGVSRTPGGLDVNLKRERLPIPVGD